MYIKHEKVYALPCVQNYVLRLIIFHRLVLQFYPVNLFELIRNQSKNFIS